MAKNLFDKVSKIKNPRWQFRRIFRWLRHGVFHFFSRPCFHGEISETKWMHNGCCSQYNKKCPFCFVNFSKKTWSAEKMEYTTTKPTENPWKLLSQIFHFWNFVTEIFRHKVMLKITILSKSWYKFLFDKLMIFTSPFGGKSLWQSFRNKKSEMTVSKDFLLASSWCTIFKACAIMFSAIMWCAIQGV